MVNDPELFPYIVSLPTNWPSADFLDLSLGRSPDETEKSETVVIYITGSATGDEDGNGRTLEHRRGGSGSSFGSDIQVRIQRRSRQSNHTLRDGSHDSLPHASSPA